MRNQHTSLLIIFFVFALFFGGVGFLLGQEYRTSNAQAPFDLSLLQQVYQTLDEEYLFQDNIDRQTLEYGAIKGFVASLGDPYTYFMDPEENQEFNEIIEGSFQGIGAEVAVGNDGEILIVAPLEGTPAKKAGLLPQDVVVQIDNVSTLGMTLDEAITRIRGKKGTTVTLSIKRESLDEPIKVSIIRDVIPIPTLEWELRENREIAYVQIFNFSDGLSEEFASAAGRILTSGASKIIIDLRGNPGGLLDEAIKVGGWFIERGETITSERAGNGQTTDYTSKGNAKLKGFPVAVLINQGSASASEILAGALKVKNNALLIGEQTFGKGTVQILKPFPDKSSLRFTTSQWLLPSGQSINEEGLAPDILVPQGSTNADEDPQLQRAIEALKKP